MVGTQEFWGFPPHPRMQSDLSPSSYDFSHTHKAEATDESIISQALEAFHRRHVCLYLLTLLQAISAYKKKGGATIPFFNSSPIFF